MSRVLALMCLLGSALAVEPLAIPKPGLPDLLALIPGDDWAAVVLIVNGKRRTGLIHPGGEAVAYKAYERAKEETIPLDSIEILEFKPVSHGSISKAVSALRRMDYAGALGALDTVPADKADEPYVRALRLEIETGRAVIEGLRATLKAEDANAEDPAFPDRLEQWLLAVKARTLDPEVQAGFEEAWHRQVQAMDETTRTRWLDLAKQARVTLTWDPEAPDKLVKGRTVAAGGDHAAAVKLFEAALAGHARLAEDDFVTLGTAYLEVGQIKQAATLFKRLPARLRNLPEMEPLLERAGVPLSFGVFGFRGNQTGVFPDADPPTRWSKGGKEWLWTLPLKGRSNASPIVNGTIIFICEEPDILIAVDKQSGKEQWRSTNSLKDAGSDAAPHKPGWISTYGYTCMTPITAGNRVWFVGGNGVVACYDLMGSRKWIQTVEVGGKLHGCAASPCLIDGVLVTYTAAGSGGHYHAFEAESGKLLWSDKSVITQGGLVPMKLRGKSYVVSSGGVVFEARTGAQLCSEQDCFGPKEGPQSRGNNWGATVVMDGTTAYFNNHYEKTAKTGMLAIDFSAGTPKERWWTPTGGRIGASHVLHDGLLYTDGGRCIDAATGAMVYEGVGFKACYSSLVMAGPFLYSFDKKRVWIFKPGRKYDEVASFDHGFEDFIASAVFEGRRMYFRDKHGLHCIAKE